MEKSRTVPAQPEIPLTKEQRVGGGFFGLATGRSERTLTDV